MSLANVPPISRLRKRGSSGAAGTAKIGRRNKIKYPFRLLISPMSLRWPSNVLFWPTKWAIAGKPVMARVSHIEKPQSLELQGFGEGNKFLSILLVGGKSGASGKTQNQVPQGVPVRVRPPAPNPYNPNLFPIGDGFGLLAFCEKFESTLFRNRLARKPSSKPGGPPEEETDPINAKRVAVSQRYCHP